MNVGESKNVKQLIQVQDFFLSLNVGEIHHVQVFGKLGISIRHIHLNTRASSVKETPAVTEMNVN